MQLMAPCLTVEGKKLMYSTLRLYSTAEYVLNIISILQLNAFFYSLMMLININLLSTQVLLQH